MNSEDFSFGTNLSIYCMYRGKYCMKVILDIIWTINNWL